MANSKTVVWGFLIGAVLFIVAALVAVARGNNVNAVFLGIGGAFFGLALTFVALSATRVKKEPPSDSAPPTA